MATAKNKNTAKETETASVKDKANETPVEETQETETTQERDLANVTPVEDENNETETANQKDEANAVTILAEGATIVEDGEETVVAPIYVEPDEEVSEELQDEADAQNERVEASEDDAPKTRKGKWLGRIALRRAERVRAAEAREAK